MGDSVVLSFLELMELHVVKALKDKGVSLQRIRQAAQEARNIVGTPYPFASKSIFTDGKNVFMRLEATADLAHTLQLGTGGQWVLEAVFQRFLKQIDFDPATRLARRWWPLGRKGGIVIDPSISFGAPIVEAAGIGTVILWEAAQREPAGAVAKWYQVDLSLVQAATSFEAALRAA